MNEFKGGPPEPGGSQEKGQTAQSERFDLYALGERLKAKAIMAIDEAVERAKEEVDAAQFEYEQHLAEIKKERDKGTDAKTIEYAEQGAKEIFENSIRDIEKNIKDSLKT